MAIADLRAGHDIKIQIDNYENDTLLLGYYHWDKQYIKDTIIRNEKNIFRVKGKDNLTAGLYLLIMRPKNSYVQIVIDPEDQKFDIVLDFNLPFETLQFNGSDDNAIFHDYVTFLGEMRSRAEGITGDEKALSDIDSLVQLKQTILLDEHPKSFAALVIRTNTEIDVPDYSGTADDVNQQRYEYYLKHYFDNTDLTDNRLVYTPFLLSRIERYIKNVVAQLPDSINNALDRILTTPDIDGEIFKLVLVHHINKYANSKFVGMDAIYVHLVEQYYATGQADWIDEESLAKMVADATALKPLLIGKKAPNITVFKRNGEPFTLHDLKSEYTLIVFWAPDCGHCKKELPKLKALYPGLKDSGLEVVSVCSKLMDDEAECWKYIDENELDSWINVSDKFLRSKFKQKYNIKSTPQVYILDRDKIILTKKIGVDQIPEVLETLKKIEAEQAGIN
jgi:peroxiredoxin